MIFGLFRSDRERDQLARVASLLAESAPHLRVDAVPFEDRLMREIRRRSGRAEERAAWAAARAGRVRFDALRPLPFAAALGLMVAAGSLALLLGGPAAPRSAAGVDTASTAGAAPSLDDYDDLVSPPREVPFTVETDLVGERRGTIPLTTYVLEPPPAQERVVRASL